MKETIRVMIPEEKLNNRIAELGEQISRDYAGEEIVMIGILKGSIMFMSELAKHITIPAQFEFMRASSYGSGTESSGVVEIKLDLDHSIEGKNVLIIEDIIDTGNTLSCLQKLLKTRGPKSLKTIALLEKPARREAYDVEFDYVGFEIPDEFVVGYGLDYDQKYRNLPYVGVVEFLD